MNLSFQHDAHWMDIELDPSDPDYGKILIFNNRIGGDHSRVDIIEPPVDGANYTLAPGSAYGDGGIYDPETDEWASLPPATFENARAFHRALWVEERDEMVIFGGLERSGMPVRTISAFDLAGEVWRSLPVLPPSVRSQPDGVWSGQSLLLFEGNHLWTLDPSAPLTLYGKF